ncbi:MAG: hypothetical protein M1828_001662 [Chrysothrix sp. TS-e1954]|nr:MAG: hypothetical protein M1828_001662 [Chrysothrix sp. TS-e1954]
MPSQALPSDSATGTSRTTRLHITPLTHELLTLILPASVRENSNDLALSYHALETFPEKSYGFVTLSEADARRVKQRIHGTYIKGMKVRVDEAREEKRAKRSKADEAAPAGGDEIDGSKKRKRGARSDSQEQGVLQGQQLPDGRHVKRGWAANGKPAMSKSSRDRKESSGKKSKSKDDAVVVMRTAIPENAPAGESVKSKRKKTQQGKGKRVADIKEFDNTTKVPTFISDTDVKSTTNAAATRYKKGRGWVNEAGQVVEKARDSRKSGSPVDSDASSEEDVDQEDSPDGSAEDADEDLDVPTAEKDAKASSAESPTEKPTTSTLESLFKRPVRASSSITSEPKVRASRHNQDSTTDENFSFFASESNEPPHPSTEQSSERPTLGKRKGSSLSLLVPPATPYGGLRDRDRALRSAAPTPDTAAIGARGRFKVPWRSQSREDDDDGEAEENTPVPDNGDDDEDMTEDTEDIVGVTDEVEGQGAEKTEFEKEFYAQRGELNRAWKARRRAVRKEKRQDASRRGATTRARP